MGVKISIITVTCNRAHVIRSAIEGVMLQKNKNYEYIIVDGASKDNTIEVLKEYEPKFEGRLRWISEPDKGLYDAINKGIKMATGDVVGIINSDDFFHRDDVFSTIAEAFEKDDSIGVTFGDERIIKPENPDVNYRFEAPWYFRPWMFRIGLEPPHPSFYARRELFEKYGYYKMGYVISADYDLMMRFLLVHRVKYKYLRHTILTFRASGISTNSSNRLMMNKEQVRACKENGVWTCLPMIYLKYFFKVPELFFGKNKK
jgi:glycosyltransferase involved in cell wall biosynthesis